MGDPLSVPDQTDATEAFQKSLKISAGRSSPSPDRHCNNAKGQTCQCEKLVCIQKFEDQPNLFQNIHSTFSPFQGGMDWVKSAGYTLARPAGFMWRHIDLRVSYKPLAVPLPRGSAQL